jgi:hypothetical protein
MNGVRAPDVLPGVRCLRAVVVAGALLGASGCASGAAVRPFRFDVGAPVPATTDLVARRMAADPELRPTWVDPRTGVVLAPWRMVGVHASVTLWPPGEERGWIVERYRVLVHASGPWASMALVDVERLLCDKRGFRWSALEVWGTCRRDGEIGEGAQARIDAKAKQIADARP